MATGKSKVLSYENGLLVLLGFTFGIVFFERNAIGPSLRTSSRIFAQPGRGRDARLGAVARVGRLPRT